MLALIVVFFVSFSQSLPYSDWIGEMFPVLGNLSLLDISLPGTHDTLTYDLSEEVSLGADDDSAFISWILHWASKLGVVPGAWIRQQAKTQGTVFLSSPLISSSGYYAATRQRHSISRLSHHVH
jgi:hypothetical protein